MVGNKKISGNWVALFPYRRLYINSAYCQITSYTVTFSNLQNITYTFQVAELEGLGQKQISTYQATITENNINGKVLAACDLNELGQIMNMTFGDWQLFRAWVLEARNPSQDCVWYVLLYVFPLVRD